MFESLDNSGCELFDGIEVDCLDFVYLKMICSYQMVPYDQIFIRHFLIELALEFTSLVSKTSTQVNECLPFIYCLLSYLFHI